MKVFLYCESDAGASEWFNTPDRLRVVSCIPTVSFPIETFIYETPIKKRHALNIMMVY
jgi:hypothetical protein